MNTYDQSQNQDRARDFDRQQLQSVARFLDAQFEIPVLRWRIGWDGIIGLIPGVGDLLTNMMSLYIVVRASELGCPPSVLMRMGFNILIDNLLDVFPVLGNICDFFWKANLKNVALIDAYLQNPATTVAGSRTWLVAVILGVLLVTLGAMAAAIFLTVFLWHFVQARWGS